MFEHKSEKVAPTRIFFRRLLAYVGLSALLILFALLVGVVGYHWFANLDWIDALLNSSMILGGMGPVSDLQTAGVGAKIFASIYALFSGLVFIVAMGVTLTPLIHRILHRFYVNETDDES